MVVEARRLVDDNKNNTIVETGDTIASSPSLIQLEPETIQALNAMGYEQAAQHVYGNMTYADWKKRHQKKATDEQMEKFKASAPLHAKHDKALLATRMDETTKPMMVQDGPSSSSLSANKDPKSSTSRIPVVPKATTSSTNSVTPSNVCCEDVDPSPQQHNKQQQMAQMNNNATSTIATTAPSTPVAKKTTPILPLYLPAPFPTHLGGDNDKNKNNNNRPLRVAVLTVSDRASRGEYPYGDLSGPAVEQALASIFLQQQQPHESSDMESNIHTL